MLAHTNGDDVMRFALGYRWVAILLALVGDIAIACQICVPMPQRTLADHLLASDAVVVAREDSTRPFHYRAGALNAMLDDPSYWNGETWPS